MNMNKYIGKIMGTPRKRGGKNDLDGDAVSNRKDCQPRNTMRQDTRTDFLEAREDYYKKGKTPKKLKRMKEAMKKYNPFDIK